MTDALEISDRLDLLDLLSNYIQIIDEAQWDRLSEIFTEDAEYDATQIGIGKVSTLRGIQDWMSTTPRTPAHIAANSVIRLTGPDAIEMTSRWFEVRTGGRPGAGVYRDTVVRTPDGWRIKNRVSVRYA